MKYFTLLALLLSAALSGGAPGYSFKIIGPQGIDSFASSLNDQGDVVGFYKEKGMQKDEVGVFFWNEDHETVFLGKSYQQRPLINAAGDVYFTQRTPVSWFDKQKVRPVVWNILSGTKELHLNEIEWAGKEAYVHCINDLGDVVVGDASTPADSTLQQYGSGTTWKKTDIGVQDLNNNGLQCGAYHHLHEGQTYLLPAIVDTKSGESKIIQVLGSFLTVSDKDEAAGVVIGQEKISGIFHDFRSDASLELEGFYITKLSSSGFAIARSADTSDSNCYLIDFNASRVCSVNELVEDENVEILYITDINAHGDLCGIGLLNDHFVALKLELKK